MRSISERVCEVHTDGHWQETSRSSGRPLSSADGDEIVAYILLIIRIMEINTL